MVTEGHPQTVVVESCRSLQIYPSLPLNADYFKSFGNMFFEYIYIYMYSSTS